MPLSAKAKGKQKAVEADGDGDGEVLQSNFEAKEVVVRFTEGITDVNFVLDPSYTVQEVKLLIREHRPALSNRRLRIIVGGRLLTDDVRLHDWLTIHYRSQPNNATSPVSKSPIRSNNTAVIQCAVGAVIQAGEEVRDTSEQDLTQIRPLRGFDRLTNAGLNESEIRVLRSQFHAERGLGYDVENVLDISHGDGSNSSELQDDYAEHILNLEDAWLDSMQSDSVEDPAGGDGNRTDRSTSGRAREDTQVKEIVEGLVLGFFFPLIPIIFFTRPRIPIFWDEDWDPGQRRVDTIYQEDASPTSQTSPDPQGSGNPADVAPENNSASGTSDHSEEAGRSNVTQRQLPDNTGTREPPSLRPNALRSIPGRRLILGWQQFRQPRSVIFTPRTRMAILTGLGINILFGLCRFLVASV